MNVSKEEMLKCVDKENCVNCNWDPNSWGGKGCPVLDRVRELIRFSSGEKPVVKESLTTQVKEDLLQFVREIDADMFVQCPEQPNESEQIKAERKRWRRNVDAVLALIESSGENPEKPKVTDAGDLVPFLLSLCVKANEQGKRKLCLNCRWGEKTLIDTIECQIPLPNCAPEREEMMPRDGKGNPCPYWRSKKAIEGE